MTRTPRAMSKKSEPDAEFIAEAQEAYIDEDWLKALDLYDVMVEGYPRYVPGWVHRSACNLKLGRHNDALGDAAKAVKLDDTNPKAHLRKGMAFFELGEAEAARMCFERGAQLDGSGAKVYGEWIKKCDDLILVAIESAVPKEDRAPDAANPENPRVDIPPASAAPHAPADPPAPRYKHQWYQSLSHVTLEVLAKNVKPDDASFQIDADRVRVTVANEDDPTDPYVLDLKLFGEVLPAQCKTSVGVAKLEVRLKKAEDAQWGDIVEGSGGASGAATAAKTVAPPPPARPAYPSSKAAQKKTVTDWDKLERELEKEEEDELSGDAALNAMFQKIYKNANEETRRAMNKSFQESAGTVLSTNWDDIGKKKTEVQPPEGMEAKKYEI